MDLIAERRVDLHHAAIHHRRPQGHFPGVEVRAIVDRDRCGHGAVDGDGQAGLDMHRAGERVVPRNVQRGAFKRTGRVFVASDDDARRPAHVVPPDRVRAGGNRDFEVAPQQLGRSAHRAVEIEQSPAEGRVRAGRAQIHGISQQDLPDLVGTHVGKLLPERSGGTRHLRGRESRAVDGADGAGIPRGRGQRKVARGDHAEARRVAAGVGIGASRVGTSVSSAATVSQPPSTAGVGAAAGQCGDGGGLGACLVAGGEHHQSVVVDHERAIRRDVGVRRGGITPRRPAPGIEHDVHAGGHQIVVHRPQARWSRLRIAKRGVARCVRHEARRHDVGAVGQRDA